MMESRTLRRKVILGCLGIILVVVFYTYKATHQEGISLVPKKPIIKHNPIAVDFTLPRGKGTRIRV